MISWIIFSFYQGFLTLFVTFSRIAVLLYVFYRFWYFLHGFQWCSHDLGQISSDWNAFTFMRSCADSGCARLSSKHYMFCFKTMLQMHKTSSQRDIPSKKYTKKHWLEQWFVIAKSRAVLPTNAYKPCCLRSVFEVRNVVSQDLLQTLHLLL